MPNACRVLCSADLHVGRGPSRIGALDPASASCAAMVGHLVRMAIDLRVDAVALAGDLVDRANHYFEAFGPLLEGLKKLSQAEIDVVCVGGNHDFDVLPRLAADLKSDRLHFLGAGGKWETATLRRPTAQNPNGEPYLNLVGWS